VSWRYFLKHQVFKAVAMNQHGELPLAAQMTQIFTELRQRYPTAGWSLTP
jgi:hypothetical protein